MKTPLPRSLVLLAALTAVASAGACRRSSGNRNNTNAQPPQAQQNPNTLLDQQAQIAPGAPGASALAHYELRVAAGERLVVSVESPAFDPVLEVVLPDGTSLMNDDYQGSRQRSQLTVSARAAGTLKVRVRPYRPGTGGAFHVRAERQAAQVAQNTNALAMPTNVQNAYQQMGSQSTPFLEYIQPSESRTHHRLPPTLTATASLRPGQEVQGTLAANDPTLPSGEASDVYSFNGTQGDTVSLALNSTTIDPYLIVVAPSGAVFADDDSGGTTNSQLSLVLAETGEYKVIASATRAGVAGSYELKFNPAARQTNVQEWFPGQPQPQPGGNTQVAAASRQGTLAQGDQRLNSGEFVDRLNFNWPVGAQIRLRLESSQFDPYLIVRAPSGSQQDNDDFSPSDRNSQLDYTVREAGQHTVMITSYRPGETGAYTLNIGGGGGAGAAQPAPGQPQPTPAQPGNVGAQTVSGSLAQGDGTRSSGEFADNFTFNWPAGAAVRLETTSSDFDTFLIVRSPSGAQQQNDDGIQGTTNSALDLVTTEAGQYTVTVSSYRTGETGAYQLSVRAPGGGGAQPQPTPVQPQPVPGVQPQPQPNPVQPGNARAREVTGTLARGDRTLQAGEFVDQHTLQFRPGEAVRLRLESSSFDTYLIVRSPSGRQHDNDDLVSGNTNSGVDIPSAEAGNYQVMVTSYRAAETGPYTLRVESGAAGTLPIDNPGNTPNNPNPNNPNPTPVPNVAGGPRVWGVFAGITDYPSGTNDLAECANDAVKMVEALTDRGLMTQDRRVLLTDGQATRQNIREAIQRIGAQAGPQDVFIFFYSGHGGRTRGGSSDQRELDGMDEYLYVYDGQIMDDEMGTLFDGIRARTSILALDACYAGGFAKDVITRPGRVGLFSSEEDVTSSVAQNFRAGGYLSHFLRLGMGGEADNDPRDNALTVGELTHYVWRQFAQHGQSVEQGEGAYQHLVVDRGAVGVGQVLWNYPR
jgi:hypothetical protein